MSDPSGIYCLAETHMQLTAGTRGQQTSNTGSEGGQQRNLSGVEGTGEQVCWGSTVAKDVLG